MNNSNYTMNVFVKKLIMPIGKVSPFYIKYVGWSFVSTMLVSVQTAMATHSMLNVVGDSDYRSFNYIGKDVIGQMGSLYYMSVIGGKTDKEPLTVLKYSDKMQQLSFIMLSLTPVITAEYFLPVAGVCNILSNISFIGYGAMNAKCIQAIAIDKNTGEIYLKITTINTLASSIGLVVGITICTYVPDHTTRTCMIPVIGLARTYTYNKAIEGII